MLLVLLLPTVVALTPPPTSAADVLVYGATPGGIVAAIAARRELGPRSVVELIEPLRRVGGMIAGGMVDDSNSGNTRAYGGVPAEFFRRVAAAYNVTDTRFGCFKGEPGLAERVFLRWLREEGVRLTTGQVIGSLRQAGELIEAATLAPSGRRIAARQWIDATYEGDLLALAGVPVLFGREGAGRWNESLAGQGLCTDAARNDAVFTPSYETFTVPENASVGGRLLPGVDGIYKAWNQTGAVLVNDSRVQSYNFRACLTKSKSPTAATPITAPAGYAASDFVLFARHITALQKHNRTVGLGEFFGCGGYGGGKCDTNDGHALGLNPMGNETYHWALSSPAQRVALRQAFVKWTLGLFHFLGTDERVPAAVRAQMRNYSLCADEWNLPGEQHLPQIPYVREGRRMDGGDFIFTQEDYRQRVGDVVLPGARSGIETSASGLNYSIALGFWFIDCHATRRTSVKGLLQNEGCVQYGRRLMDKGAVWEIPFGVIVPPRDSVNNLLAACTPSSSHVAFQGFRVEPTYMTMGQAAGVASALSVQHNTQPRHLDAALLQAALRRAGAILKATEMFPKPVVEQCVPGAPPGARHVADPPTGRGPAQIPVLNQVVRSDWLNVRDVGAVGDGEHDDTAAIQKAIDMLTTDPTYPNAGNPNQHLTLYFPPGEFLTTRTLVLGSNKTAHHPGGLEWVSLIGHGAATRIIWAGAAMNASMLWSNGCTRCRIEGLSFLGNHRAGVGVDHRSFSRYESRFLHVNLAFDAFTIAGIRAGKQPYGTASAEMLYQNCLFSNSSAGLQLLAANQYDNSLEGCLFADCAIGLDDQVGNFYLRNSRFERSTDVDIVASAHSNSVRRVVSVNSSSFVRVETQPFSSELKIDDCRVHGWTNPGSAIRFGARGPLQVIDSAFSGAPRGATSVIQLSEAATSVVLSGAVSEAGVPLMSAAEPDGTVVMTVPPDARKTGPNQAITTHTKFLKGVWPGPIQVIDAVEDGHAAGNATGDDTAALQAIIDAVAAQNAGSGRLDVVGYIPAGRYLITRPLRIPEAVHLDGSGYGSQIVMAATFVGEAGVVVVGAGAGASSTAGVMLTNLGVDNKQSGFNSTQPVLVKGGCGKVFLTNIHVDSTGVYSCAENANATGHGHASGCQALGLRLDGLTSTDTLHANVLDGRLVVSDSADAVVLIGFHVQGGSVVSHPSAQAGPATGFMGELFRAESFQRFDLQVNDSQSYVISDYYTEQTWQYILLGGTAVDAYPGRVTVGAVKVGTNMYRYPGDDDLMPVIEVDNFHGQLLHFGGHFEFEHLGENGNASAQRTPAFTLHHSGAAEFLALFFGDTWFWLAPRWDMEGSSASVCTLGNLVTMDDFKNLTVPDQCVGRGKGWTAPTHSAQLHAVAAGWDHIRELGNWDLKLNFPNVVAAPHTDSDSSPHP